jgi:YD repeat-containing protein
LTERIDANGNRVALRHNHEGELVEITNEAGERYHIRRDANGVVVTEVTFDRRRLHYQSDLIGRPIEYTNGAGERTAFE